MCRSRVRNVFHVVTLGVVVLMAIAVVPSIATSQSEDIYSTPDILVINPDRTTHWSRSMKHQRYNDPPQGYSEIFGLPWALFSPSSQGMFEPTNPVGQQSPYAYPQTDNAMVNQDYGSYGRRSASGMSPAEKEYQAVRRALARDRVQPLRRSMVPTRRTRTDMTRKREEKTIEDLLPLMYSLGSLIDQLDSPIGGLEQTTGDGNGRTKRRVMGLLKSIITRLQKAVEKRTNQVMDEPRKEKAAFSDGADSFAALETQETTRIEEKDPPQNRISAIDYVENETEDQFLDGVDPRDNPASVEALESGTRRASSPQDTSNNSQKKEAQTPGESTPSPATAQRSSSTGMVANPSSRRELDQSAIPVLHSLAENPGAKGSGEPSETFTGLVPEHKAFKTVKAADEDAGSPAELAEE